METAGPSYTSDDLCHQSTRRHIQEESILHSYARENLKFHKGMVLLRKSYPAVTGLKFSVAPSGNYLHLTVDPQDSSSLSDGIHTTEPG